MAPYILVGALLGEHPFGCVLALEHPLTFLVCFLLILLVQFLILRAIYTFQIILRQPRVRYLENLVGKSLVAKLADRYWVVDSGVHYCYWLYYLLS